MADLTFYNLSMTGAEADSGIRVGMDIGALNGIPYSNGNNEILTAIPGVDYGYPLLRGYGPPTADTAASFGQHYYDLSATKPPFEYICVAFSETEGFVWRQHNDAGYFQATYGTTTYQDIIKNYNLGKVCIVVDSNNDIYYLGQVDTNQLTFYRAFRNVSSAQDGARIEYKNVRVTSTNTWSSFYYYGENAANRTQVLNEQSTDTQYPTAKAVYTYGQSIDTAAQGYAETAEEAAKGYTDEQLAPVAESADKAELYALGAYVTPTAAGDIASFDDGAENIPVKELVVNIEPVQDLNGYDAPWPPGGGRNLIDVPEYENASSSVIRSENESKFAAIEFKENTQYTLSEFVSSSNETDKWGILVRYTDGTSEYLWLLDRGATVPSVTTAAGKTVETMNFAFVSGFILSIANTQLEEGSTATTYSPYSNICPISGWTGVNVARTGSKNLFGGLALADKLVDVASATLDTGAETVSYTARNVSEKRLFEGVFKPNTIYTFIFNGENPTGNEASNLQIYYTDGSRSALAAFVNGLLVRASAPDKTVHYLGGRHSNGITILNYNLCGVFEGELTEDDFEPFVASNTYNITFPDEAGTVYGGSLDVTSGVLTVDRAQIASYSGETLPGTWISDRNVYSIGSTPSVGAQVVYRLATHVTYQLTPTEVNTLLGVNNVYSDTGDTEVTYRADPTLIYNKLAAAIISSGGAV